MKIKKNLSKKLPLIGKGFAPQLWDIFLEGLPSAWVDISEVNCEKKIKKLF